MMMNNSKKHRFQRPQGAAGATERREQPEGLEEATPKLRLLDRVRMAIRTRHYSPRTEKAYVSWIKRFIFFHDKRHPKTMGEAEISAFVSYLATVRKVSASTQCQALSALLFLYRNVLRRDLNLMEITRSKRPEQMPLVLSYDEVHAILDRMDGTPALMASLLYGSGMRLLECCGLRVKDVEMERLALRIRAGKGAKDRVTMLPETLAGPLADHLKRVRRQHERDLSRGAGFVELPFALSEKYPNEERTRGPGLPSPWRRTTSQSSFGASSSVPRFLRWASESLRTLVLWPSVSLSVCQLSSWAGCRQYSSAATSCCLEALLFPRQRPAVFRRKSQGLLVPRPRRDGECAVPTVEGCLTTACSGRRCAPPLMLGVSWTEIERQR